MIEPLRLESPRYVGDSAIYRVQGTFASRSEVYLVSTPASRELLTDPLLVGTRYAGHLSAACEESIRLLQAIAPQRLPTTSPVSVLIAMRGALSFGLPNALWNGLGIESQVSFLTPLRQPDGGVVISESPVGFRPPANSLPATIAFGDIISSGATATALIHMLRAIGPKVERLVIATIATQAGLEAVDAAVADVEDRHYSCSTTILALESLFAGPGTANGELGLGPQDLHRRSWLSAPEFEKKRLSRLGTFCERCAIYDGGERAFEPDIHRASRQRWWDQLVEERGDQKLHDLAHAVAGIDDFSVPYSIWRRQTGWAEDNRTEALARDIYVLGTAQREYSLGRSITEYASSDLVRPMIAPIDKVAYLRLEEGKILVTRSTGKDVWYIPGGKREGDESDLETLQREVLEELSVVIHPASARFFGEFIAQAHGKPEGVLVRMRCFSAAYKGDLVAANEIAELAWFTYADRTRVSPVDQLIFDDLRAAGKLLERGTPSTK